MTKTIPFKIPPESGETQRVPFPLPPSGHHLTAAHEQDMIDLLPHGSGMRHQQDLSMEEAQADVAKQNCGFQVGEQRFFPRKKEEEERK